jgi:hypothetical protein
MGFFSSWTGMSTYESELKSYGLNPYSLPADLHSRVCSYTTQDYERRRKRGTLLGVPREYCFQCSGALVALCVLGPSSYSRYEQRVSMEDQVAYAAERWRTGGPESFLDAMIIRTVSDAGVLHAEFADAFNVMLQGT